jgi:CHAT domain-containing protein
VAALGPTTDWIVSPDGAIWEVPFDALMDPNGKHVIETRAISMTPSLTAAIRLLERPQSATPSSIPLLAIGNPLPSSSPLPDAAEEAERIGADRRGAVVLTGVSATRKAFLDQAPNARIIHLAAHAGLNNRDPLSSFVSLGSASDDGMLTAREIMDMHLRADLVVFSACETALGTAGPGEGMIGMGWALSVAGASSSILSYWKIDSSASKDFMIALYRRMGAANTPKASALRQTALEIMQSPGHRHPFYWAPFTLWGS